MAYISYIIRLSILTASALSLSHDARIAPSLRSSVAKSAQNRQSV